MSQVDLFFVLHELTTSEKGTWWWPGVVFNCTLAEPPDEPKHQQHLSSSWFIFMVHNKCEEKSMSVCDFSFNFPESIIIIIIIMAHDQEEMGRTTALAFEL